MFGAFRMASNVSNVGAKGPPQLMCGGPFVCSNRDLPLRESASSTDINSLNIHKLAYPKNRKLAAISRLSDASEWQSRVGTNVLVYETTARLQLPCRNLLASLQVTSKNRCTKPE